MIDNLKARVAGLAVLLACATSCEASNPFADMLVVGGTVHTLGASGSVEALAIRDGRVLAAGSRDSLDVWEGPETQVIDLAGRTAIPGLGDNHFHSVGGGPGVDLTAARSVPEVVATIGDRAATLESGVLIYSNSDWHEGQLEEQRLPLRDDLDPVSRAHPVVLVRGGHEYILNSVALEQFGIDETVVDPPGGRFGRYPDGRLNGELVDRAKDGVTLPARPERTFDQQVDAIAREHQRLNAMGLTNIRYAGSTPELWKILEALRERDALTLRVSVLLRPPYSTEAEDFAEALEAWDVSPDDGDEWLRVGGVKLGVDGGFEGGLMREPYLEPWGDGGSYLGLQTVPRERFVSVVSELNRLGWRVATHAVGDAAIDLVLDAYEAADAEDPIAGERWVIEHGFIPQPDHFERMRALGLAVTAQNHLYLAAPSLVKYWGAERAAMTTPLRSYLDEGVSVSLGTDSPVIPYNPWWALYHFATRGTISAGVLDPAQAVSTLEALRASTAGNAFLMFAEDERGTLDPGMLADFTVVEVDPLAIAPESLESIQPDLTVVGGRIVWEKP